MVDFTLIVGNKAYSSWSLRAWLPLAHVGVPFEEVVLPFDGPAGVPTRAVRERSPSGKVPLLQHGDLLVWDSLAIGEYLAEVFPEAGLWPAGRGARAAARSISAEMHSGFAALRTAMPMNVRREPFELATGPEVKGEVARILSIWGECRRAHGGGGPFLFGAYTVADAMFAPIASRFRTYGVALDAGARAYVDAIHAHAPMQRWIAAARQEPWTIDAYERAGKSQG
ncbi:MAG TPA: glutathione S-transferase family protein [Polyangiaceae bacterium]|jgi:glutathione S-transferase